MRGWSSITIGVGDGPSSKDDPALGQFLSPDTLVPDAGLVLDYNRYMYARGNPLKYTDPTGHTPYFDILGGGGGYGTKESMAAMGTAMALYVATYSLTVDQALWEGPYVTPRSHSTPQDRPFETPHDSAPTVLDTPLLGPEPRPDYATPGNSATTFQTDGLLEGYSLSGQRSAQELMYASFTSGNFRENLRRLTGNSTSEIQGLEAHHVLPRQFEDRFLEMGIENIHNPQFGSWVAQTPHRQWSREYNDRWQRFLARNPTTDEILNFARQLGEEYGFETHFD